MIRGLSALAFALLIMGCRNSADSMTSSLSGSLKPEGFLVIKDIAADPAKSGYFLVTCASSSGDKKSSVSQAELESNKVCLPAVAMASSGSSGSAPSAQPAPGASSSASSSSAASAASGFQAKNLQPTYLKVRPALDVTGNLSSLRVGVDYCAITTSIYATNICVYSEKELKVTGVKVEGCDLTSGFLFAQHFSVAPNVSACR